MSYDRDKIQVISSASVEDWYDEVVSISSVGGIHENWMGVEEFPAVRIFHEQRNSEGIKDKDANVVLTKEDFLEIGKRAGWL